MIKRIALLMLVTLMGALVASAAPTVTDVVAKQWYPWGLVDITCKVSGIDETIDYPKFVLSAVLPDSENVSRMSHFWVIRGGAKSSNLTADGNGNYHLLWDAKADLGEVRHDNMVVRVITLEYMREKVQLWKDGPYWATTNIGAEKPEDRGYYFWWGDTVGYYKQRNGMWIASDGSNSKFSFTSGNTPTYSKSVATLQSEGWITSDRVLVPEHDAAHKHWGGDWRLPTEQEFDDLNNKCDWTWSTMNGVNGYVVCGRGDYSSKSIFLPCTGFGDGTSCYSSSSVGWYWSSVSYSSSGNYCGAWYLYFNSGSRYTTNKSTPWVGLPVRPLQGFTK